MVQIKGLMMNIKQMIPHGRIDCYRYVAIGLLAALPLVSYSEERLMQPVEDVLLAEISPLWLDGKSSTVSLNDSSISVSNQNHAQNSGKLPLSRQAVVAHQAQHQKIVQTTTGLKKVNLNLTSVSTKDVNIASLHEVAQEGSVEAQYQLGMRYQYGDGVARNITQANQWLLTAARSGDGRSQHALSMFYQQYANTEDGAKKAVFWEKKAAIQGSADAQYALGIMFKNGRLVVENEAEARRWLAMAAKQGHLSAQLVLEE